MAPARLSIWATAGRQAPAPATTTATIDSQNGLRDLLAARGGFPDCVTLFLEEDGGCIARG